LLLTISNQNIFLQTKSLKNRTKQDKTTQYRTIYHFFPNTGNTGRVEGLRLFFLNYHEIYRNLLLIIKTYLRFSWWRDDNTWWARVCFPYKESVL